MVETPVLYMTFARPDYARQTWNAIKAAKPRTLYFYSNKGREEKTDEVARNEIIRSYIKEIDWECNLHTWFRDEYVDVYTSLLGAKQWAFKNEDRLIMLEEDCLASLAFFEFCDHFLELYKDDMRINFVTGNNYAIGYHENDVDHYITRSIHHHGWATWKDRWDMIDFNMMPEDIVYTGDLKKYYHNVFSRYLYFRRHYLGLHEFILQTKCWDFIKVFNQIKDKTYGVTPIYNLVQNVGVNGVHENGELKIQFKVDNGANQGNYKFIDKTSDFPNDSFDRYESKVEGYMISPLRFYIGEFYHRFFKL